MPMRNITMAEWNLIKKIRATGDCGCGTFTEEKVAAAVAIVAEESAGLRKQAAAEPASEEPAEEGAPEDTLSEGDPTPTTGVPALE